MARYELRATEERGRPDFEGCARCDGTQCDARTYRVPPVGVSGWPGCPDSLIRSPVWRAGVRLWQMSKISALHGWPQLYLPWAVEIVLALEDESQALFAEQLQPPSDSKGVPTTSEQKRRTWRPGRGGD